MRGKYIYGITKKKDLPQNLKKSGLSAVHHQGLSLVTGDEEYKDYHSLAKAEAIKELTRHQQIIEKIMENFGTILPVKFGTILKDEKEVRLVLEKNCLFLQSTWQKMKDKIELDLVCFWNEQKAAQLVYQESKKIQNLQKNLIKKRKSTLEDKIALGKLVADCLTIKREKIASKILAELKKEVVASCNHSLADINMLLNQAFLIEKENEERFNHALNVLDSKFANLVKFRLVGPLPPYSFATVVIDVLDKSEIEKARKSLNLDGEISQEKVKEVYGKLAIKLHPDHGGNPVEFEMITWSYKLLVKYAEQGLIGVYLHKWEER